MNKKIILAAIAAVIFAGGAAIYTRQSAAPTMSQIVPAAGEDAAEIDTSGIVEMSLGNPDAPVTVIEYASFTCPHCADFHQDQFQQIKKSYIDTDKVHFIYREVYFDRYGLWAGMVARCGGEMRYFGIADMIFEQQKDWLGAGDPLPISQALQKIGKTAGLTDDQLDQCLNDGDKARALYALFQKNAEEHDITGTPSFIINGEKYSNMDYAKFAAVLDEKLAE